MYREDYQDRRGWNQPFSVHSDPKDLSHSWCQCSNFQTTVREDKLPRTGSG